MGVRWGEGRIVGDLEGSSVMSGDVVLFASIGGSRAVVGYTGWAGLEGKRATWHGEWGMVILNANEETDDTG
jgi:hypothetical protein